MSRRHLTFTVAFGLLCLGFSATGRAQEEGEKITFDDHVKAIFRQRCVTCHNTSERSADLDLSNYTAMMQGGASGPVIEPGDVGGSYLYALVNHDDEPAMPPDSDPIPSPEIAMISKWIEGGALENKGSKFTPKKKNNLAMAAPATGRPEVVPVPSRIVREPVVVTEKLNATGPIATSPWAPIVAVGGENQVLLFDATNHQLTGVLPFPEGRANVLKFSRNGSLLLAGGGHDAASGKVVVFDVKSGKRVIEVGDELDTVLAADISSDHQLIALGGPQKIVRVYSTQSGEVLYELTKHTDWVYSLEFSPDGVLLATGDRNGGLFVWEALTGREYLSLRGHTAAIADVSWRLDSNVLASGSEDTTIKLWEMVNGGQIKSWGAHGGGVQSVEYSRDGRITSCGRDRVAKLWDGNGGGLRTFEAFGDIALAVSFCDETDEVIAGDWTGTIRTWKAADGTRTGELNQNPPTIEQRIASITTQVAAERQAFAPIAKAYEDANLKLSQLKAEVEATQNQTQMLTAQIQKMQEAMASTQKTMTDSQQQSESLTDTVETLQAAMPLLMEAAEKNRAAAEALGDEALKQLANQLAEAAKTKTAELDQQTEALIAAKQQYEDAKTKFAQLNTELAELQKTSTEAQQKMNQLMPQVKPTEEATVAAQTSHDEAKARLVSVEGQLAFWKSEAEFAKAFDALKAKQTAANEALLNAERTAFELGEAAQAVQAAHNEQDAKVKQAVAAHQEQVNARVAQMTKIEELKTQLTAKQQQQAAATQTISKLAKTIELVKPLAASASQAAKQVPDDAELAAAAKQFNDLVATRTQEHTAAMQQASTYQMEANKLASSVEEATQMVASMEAAIKTAAEVVTAEQAKLTEMVAALQAKNAEVEQATAAVATAEASVEQVNAELATLQGIE